MTETSAATPGHVLQRDEPVSVLARPTLGEVVRARLAVYFRHKLVWGVAALVAVNLVIPMNRQMLGPTLYWGFAFWFAMVPLFYCLVGLRQPLAREMFAQGIPYVLTDGGLEYAHSLGKGTAAWSLFRDFRENEAVFSIRQGIAHILFPKRDFATAEDVARARRLLQRHVGGR